MKHDVQEKLIERTHWFDDLFDADCPRFSAYLQGKGIEAVAFEYEPKGPKGKVIGRRDFVVMIKDSERLVEIGDLTTESYVKSQRTVYRGVVPDYKKNGRVTLKYIFDGFNTERKDGHKSIPFP